MRDRAYTSAQLRTSSAPGAELHRRRMALASTDNFPSLSSLKLTRRTIKCSKAKLNGQEKNGDIAPTVGIFLTHEPDLEGNHGENDGHAFLDFEDPSWIIDHHRPNLITKICKPVGSLFSMIFTQRSKMNKDSDRKSERRLSSRGHEIMPDERQPEHNNQHLQCGIGAINSELKGNEESYNIDLSELQRLRLRQLQHKLVYHAVDLRYDAMEPSGWAEDLREYVQALQDYDYMAKYALRKEDPFIVTGERAIDRLMLQVAMRNKENEADPLRWEKSILSWEALNIRPAPIGGTRDGNLRQSWVKGFRQRLVVAAVGGILLIAPMWLMVLHRTLYTALVSTSVFVSIFGLMMALFIEGLKDVLSSTAAYAAVLVVFVGLTVPNNTS
ncbi:hypothetical protein DTO164E3_2806 [Paecilomyces variotii]|nr:hypothetical protein DTO032I3_4789 [Paecilomyces variotii]KAJ9202833.1 hypothetical protein DTO164E3_2806 [Paecilomyces variotii]KAJ9278798.1 hypothetical protein DTO021D3_4421 [Paecilomyces variotii]KAJ9289703.1 hypothetical protein DTO021C3_2774 [Paecilomyces variotii]KAJ9325089.1 hypothetical protein DTO027B3_3883 [Paecilomyces variotii]